MAGSGASSMLRLTLKIWRQRAGESEGRFESYDLDGVSTDMSFL